MKQPHILLVSAVLSLLSPLSQNSLAQGSLQESRRPEVTLPALLAAAQQNGDIAGLRQLLFSKLDALAAQIGQAPVAESAAAEIVTALKNQFDRAIARGQLRDLSRWPQIHVRHIPLLQGLGDFIHGEIPASVQLPSGSFESLMGSCPSNLEFPPLPEPLRQMPSLRYGHFPNYNLSPCVHEQSQKIAQIMTALAQDTGFTVTYNNQSIHTPDQLIQALRSTGHHVIMQDERTYANFLSFIVGDQANLRAPLWLNTGIVSAGKEVIIPMGHSQTVWHLTGPVYNARLSFYLGTGGVGFYARTDSRPHWTGLSVAYETQDNTVIDYALLAASLYQKRIIQEAALLYPQYPSHGYGVLGVCNDSTALIELYSHGTVSGYPLVRPARFANVIGDSLSPYFRRIPSDPELSLRLSQPRVRGNVIGRILEMMPHDVNQTWWDEDLRQIYVTLLAEGGSSGP